MDPKSIVELSPIDFMHEARAEATVSPEILHEAIYELVQDAGEFAAHSEIVALAAKAGILVTEDQISAFYAELAPHLGASSEFGAALTSSAARNPEAMRAVSNYVQAVTGGFEIIRQLCEEATGNMAALNASLRAFGAKLDQVADGPDQTKEG